MKRTTQIISLVMAAFLAPATPYAQEPVFPAGYSITSEYLLSDTVLSLGDTLTVTRLLTNGESYSVDGIFLTEYLPAQLHVASYTLTIDGLAVPCLFEGPITNEVVPGYRCYSWTVDSPDPGESVQRSVNPGEELRLEYRVTSSDIGIFSLPMHTTVGYGNGGGIFATDTEDTLRVTIALDVDDDSDDLLPASFLLSRAYPNPFNAEVTIFFAGGGIAHRPLHLEVFNTLGRQVEDRVLRPDGDEGTIRWSPDANVGTGLFFYRLSGDGLETTGKLLLLK